MFRYEAEGFIESTRCPGLGFGVSRFHVFSGMSSHFILSLYLAAFRAAESWPYAVWADMEVSQKKSHDP